MNGDFFNFCLEKGLLKPSEVESVRSYRRMPKGEIGGNAWWEKVTVSAACDIAASFKHLDKAVGAYRDNLTHQGYDAVVYLNDIEGFASPCAIVFDDKQVEVVETLGLTQTQEDLDRARNPTDFRRRLEGLVLGA
jgi:hypothetical protein